MFQDLFALYIFYWFSVAVVTTNANAALIVFRQDCSGLFKIKIWLNPIFSFPLFLVWFNFHRKISIIILVSFTQCRILDFFPNSIFLIVFAALLYLGVFIFKIFSLQSVCDYSHKIKTPDHANVKHLYLCKTMFITLESTNRLILWMKGFGNRNFWISCIRQWNLI